jgi:hypothetical protein
MNPGTTKRQREMARRQRQQEKTQRKQQRNEEKKARLANVPAGEDPDLVGIVPGPQPLQEDFPAEVEAGEDDEA